MVRAGAQSGQRTVHRRMAKDGFQSLADGRKYHAWSIRIPRERRAPLRVFSEEWQRSNNPGARGWRRRVPRRLRFLATNDLIAGPVAAFYEDIREQAGDQFARRQVVEDHHSVHGFQSSENFRALAFRDNWTSLAF